MVETCNKNVWIKELQQLEKEDIAMRSMLAQQDVVLAALDKTKDLVIITDLKHNVQVNKIVHNNKLKREFFITLVLHASNPFDPLFRGVLKKKKNDQ